MLTNKVKNIKLVHTHRILLLTTYVTIIELNKSYSDFYTTTKVYERVSLSFLTIKIINNKLV